VNKNPLKRPLCLCNLILRTASLLVPRRQRSEWLREWHGEVWHWAHFLVESARLSPRTEQELLQHCSGCFVDAIWHRFNRVAVLNFVHSYPLRPSFCLLSVVVAILALLAMRPPSLSFVTSAFPANSDSGHLLVLSLHKGSPWTQPETLRNSAFEWSRSNGLVETAEVFAWRPSVLTGPSGRENLLSARVTPGLLHLLGTQPILGKSLDSAGLSQCEKCVVISDSIWRDQFRGDPKAIGAGLYLNGQRVKVVGVLPHQFSFPGISIGAYRLFGTGAAPLLPNFEWPGALVRVRPTIELGKPELQRFLDQRGDLPGVKLDVLSFGDIEHRRVESFAALLLISLLLVLAANWRTLVLVYSTAPNHIGTSSLLWWFFFALKTILLLTFAWITSVDAVQTIISAWGWKMQEYVGAVMMWLFLVGITLVLTWSIKDQFARCRCCLSRLRVQIALGDALGPFSEPRGVDLLCDEGHGVLHVPVMQLASLDSNRWTHFDKSWRDIAQSA
jgi:hypothetical protein